MAPRGKIVRSNSAQIKLLVEYMSTNPLFAAGQFTGPLGAQKLDDEWNRLHQMLAELGPDKSVTQWKHTWRDLKKKARDEAGRARLARGRTGNTVPIPDISENSKKILGTIGDECALGIAVEEETGIGDAIIQPQSEPEGGVPRASVHVSPGTAGGGSGGGGGSGVQGPAPRTARGRGRAPARSRGREGHVERYLAALNATNSHIQELVAEMRLSNFLARIRRTRPISALCRLNP